MVNLRLTLMLVRSAHADTVVAVVNHYEPHLGRPVRADRQWGAAAGRLTGDTEVRGSPMTTR